MICFFCKIKHDNKFFGLVTCSPANKNSEFINGVGVQMILSRMVTEFQRPFF